MAQGAPASSTAGPDNDGPHDSSASVGEAIGAMLLSAWVLIANFFIIISILRSSHRRRVSLNLHVCNLSLVGILIGGVVLPLYGDLLLREQWEHGGQLCRVWLMVDVVAGVASVLVLFSAVFDRFLHFSCPGSVGGGCRFVLSAALILFPWAVACGLVIPLYTFGETGHGVGSLPPAMAAKDSSSSGIIEGAVAAAGSDITYEAFQGGRNIAGNSGNSAKTLVSVGSASGVSGGNVATSGSSGAAASSTGDVVESGAGFCFLHLHTAHAVSLELAGYAVPALAAVGLLVATSLTWCVRRGELVEMEFSHEREHKGLQVLTLWLVTLAVVGMWFPFCAMHLLTYLMDYTWPTHWTTFAVWMAYANSGVNPLLWLLMPRLRESLWSLMCCCFCCCACCCGCCREKRAAYQARRRSRRRHIEDKDAGVAMIDFKGR